MILKFLLSITYVVNLGNYDYCVTYADTGIAKKMSEAEEIVPELIKDPPKNLLNVSYVNEHNETIIVHPGMFLDYENFFDKPIIDWDAEPKAYYTIIMLDPAFAYESDLDYYIQYLYWLVADVCKVKHGQMSKGEILAEYNIVVQPSLFKTHIKDYHRRLHGPHKRVFLVYKQAAKYSTTTAYQLERFNNTESRMNFRLKEFTKKLKLNDLVAGNYFNQDIIQPIKIF